MIDFNQLRENLVKNLKKRSYIQSDQVKNAMLNVYRHLFIPGTNQKYAYNDSPLITFENQTISAPHMNAIMCEELDLRPGQKVLEIGTGSGYHASLVAYIISNQKKDKNCHVYTIERHDKLVDFAKNNIIQADLIEFITVIHGDGTLGYLKEAPYDRILVTAAGPKIPELLIKQLKIGGKMCIPVGNKHSSQELIILTKTEDGIERKTICRVIFVPLIGKDGFS